MKNKMRHKKLKLSLFLILGLELTNIQAQTDTSNTFTDSRDGTIYKTVTIGDQVWMAENLKYLSSVSKSTIGSQTTPYYYVGEYSDTSVSNAKSTRNYQTYGILYNWEAAKTSCPTGWHLPNDDEWTKLSDYLGGEDVAGDKLKEIGIPNWSISNDKTTNEIGFKALPGGHRSYDGNFYAIGFGCLFWSATEYDANYVYGRHVDVSFSNIYRGYYNKEAAFSVRCVKN